MKAFRSGLRQFGHDGWGTQSGPLSPLAAEGHDPMQKIDFEIRGEFITLDRLLKATGLAGSGGQAKTLVADGKVQVDGQDELRKTAKLRAGQVVALTGVRIRLLPPGAAVSPDPAAE
jgi:ribosome-associated protein